MKKIKKLPSYISLDPKVRPQDDFYGYACNQWCQDNPLPATKSRWGPFHALAEKVTGQIEDILDDWLEAEDLSYEQRQVVAYCRALLDKDKHGPANLATLENMLNRIDGLAKKGSVSEMLAEAAGWGVEAFFSLSVSLDKKNSRRFLLDVHNAPLDLPNRDYYLNPSAKMRAFRRAYLKFLRAYPASLPETEGFKDLKPREILEIETLLAELNWPVGKARDRRKTYNLYSWEEFGRKFKFDWTGYCESLGISAPQEVVVLQPSYLRGTLKYLSTLPTQKTARYLKYKLLLSFGSLIGENVAEANFDFFGRELAGAKEMKPLKRRVLESADETFRDIFGKEYVKRHFPNKHKEEIRRLAEMTQAAFRKRLEENDWMSPQSRRYAKEKLDKIIINVGYGGFWRDYGRLELDATDAVGNALKVNAIERNLIPKLLKEEPNRRCLRLISENAQTVNAWTYQSQLNTNYPAAFLQPPFYDPDAGTSYNLGSLCSVIGHELTHNFDDQGSQYDQEGNLNDWLDKEEKAAFKKRLSRFMRRANKYQPVADISVKGNQVIGEMVADLGGMEIVLDIARSLYGNQEERREAMRQVFIAHAFIFATNDSPQSRIAQAKAGVHPDGFFRVNGIFPHCNDFYEVFDVKKGDKLYLKPSERVSIW